MVVKYDGMKGLWSTLSSSNARNYFEQVATHLEAQILSGKLEPGDQLPPERDLQSRFGVGRPAIREALISLQKAGLVELTNGARARVADADRKPHLHRHGAGGAADPVDRGGPASFPGCTHVFEVGLAREAAVNATPSDLESLKAALEINRRAIGDRDRFTLTDIAFHFELPRIARNPVFIALHDQISEWLKEQRVVTLAARGQEKTAYEAHKAIYDGIAARDPDRAEAAMRDHLQQLASTFWRQRGADPAG